MTIYQVLNEQDQLAYEYEDFEDAVQEADMLTVWDEEHYYHVEPLYLE